MTYFNHTSGYYKKMAELQDKLKKSEEERSKLEEKFSIIMKTCREEEEKKILSFRQVYEKFLEDDKKRQDRNERILQILDRIEAQAATLTAKSERLRLLKKHYEAYLLYVYPLWKNNGKFETNSYTPAHPRFSTTSSSDLPLRQQTANHLDANLFGSTYRSSVHAESDISRFTTQPVVKTEPLSLGKLLGSNEAMTKDSHEVNQDKTIDNYINVAAKLLNVPKGELEEYEKYDEEKSVHTEQDTSRDLLNISLSDDGVLEDKKKEHALPNLAPTKVEEACRITVKEVKEVPATEDLRPGETLRSAASRNGNLLSSNDTINVIDNIAPNSRRRDERLEPIPNEPGDMECRQEYGNDNKKGNENTTQLLDQTQLVPDVLEDFVDQNDSTDYENRKGQDEVNHDVKLFEDRKCELNVDHRSQENEQYMSENNQPRTDSGIHDDVEYPLNSENYPSVYNEGERMEENLAENRHNYSQEEYEAFNYQEGYITEGEEQYPNELQEQNRDHNEQYNENYTEQYGNNGNYYYGDNEVQDGDTKQYDTLSQQVINYNVAPNESDLHQYDPENSSLRTDNVSSHGTVENDFRESGYIDENENESNDPTEEGLHTEYDALQYPAFEEQSGFDRNIMDISREEDVNKIATDMHEQIQIEEDQLRTFPKTEINDIIVENENNPEYSHDFPVDAAHEEPEFEATGVEAVQGEILLDDTNYLKKDDASADEMNPNKSHISQKESEEILDPNVILTEGTVLEEIPNNSADPLQGSLRPAETDSSESSAESQEYPPFGITGGKRSQQISKSEVDSILASDQEDVEGQLAALVLQPPRSIPETSLPENHTEPGREETLKAKGDAVETSKVASNELPTQKQKVSKPRAAPQSGLEATAVASKKNPTLIKVLESDSESLNLSESITDSNEFDFSTE